MPIVMSAHQPNCLPWLGFFHKMTYSDVFVFLDDVQFTNKTYTNRYYVKFNGNKVRLSVPVLKSKSLRKIREIEIDTRMFSYKHIQTFHHAYGKSIGFDEIFPILLPHFEMGKINLAELNMGLIRALADYMELTPRFIRLSDLGLKSKKNQLLIDIAKKCEVDIFVSGVGARAYISGHEYRYAEKGILLAFQNFIHPVYVQSTGPFLAGCSIVDLLFNTGRLALDHLVSQKQAPYIYAK